jgi:hypothetical protein
LKEPSVLVNLECNTAIPKKLAELACGRCSTVDPALIVRVVNGHDAHPVLKCESDSSDTIAGENSFTRAKPLERTEEWSVFDGEGT